MDVVSRIKQFMEEFQLSPSQFADAAGIPRPTLSQLFNGRNGTKDGTRKVSSDILTKIHKAYPELNMMWLLFGDGDMVTDKNIEFSKPQNPSNSPSIHTQETEHEDHSSLNLFENEFTNYPSEKFAEPILDESHPKTPTLQPSHTPPAAQPPVITIAADSKKRIQSIMVFYSDDSYEVFTPAKESKSK